MQETKKRVSDVITDKDISKWRNGDIVAISAGCGAGKSYFIKNVLYKRAKAEKKKILMLIHRKRCVEQFQMEIKTDNKTDTIDVQTYQSIEFAMLNNKPLDFSQYAYIVSDEFHYFIEDSSFNSYTDLSFDSIIRYNHAVKIFMSATGDTMINMMIEYKNRINRKMIMYQYSINHDYTHLRNLKFFYQNDTIKALAYEFKKVGRKAIFFIQSAKEAHSLYKAFQDCALFLCGKSSDSGQKYSSDIDEGAIKSMLANQNFDKLFLITTGCFDAGANIIDTELHDVVIDMKNVSSLIQCLGRKRSQGADDYLDVYIKAVSNRQLGGIHSTRVDGLKRANFLLQHDTRKYVEEYPRDDKFGKFHKALIYDEPMSKRNKNTCTKKVNMMIYEKYKLDIQQCDDMKKIGYAQYIANIFRFGNGYGRYYSFVEEGQLRDYLEMLAVNQVVMLTAEDKKPLIDKMNVKHNGKLLKSCNSLNAALEEKRYMYRIETFETSRIIDGNKKKFKSAWRVVKIE